MLPNPRMLHLMPEIFWSGISIAVYSSLFSTMINDSIDDDPDLNDDENEQN